MDTNNVCLRVIWFNGYLKGSVFEDDFIKPANCANCKITLYKSSEPTLISTSTQQMTSKKPEEPWISTGVHPTGMVYREDNNGDYVIKS